MYNLNYISVVGIYNGILSNWDHVEEISGMEKINLKIKIFLHVYSKSSLLILALLVILFAITSK